VGALVNGKYRVGALVGAGGMGKIYLAHQLPLGRPVALKISGVGTEPGAFEKRFFREASMLSKVQHPNIVTIYDYGAVDAPGEQYFIAMEFLSGKTLAERAAEGPMPFPAASKIAAQIARGLGEAHAQGIVHRDLKPSNVMLVEGRDGEEHVKVIDFGIVKLVGQIEANDEDLTQEGCPIGSPRYMAPEQLLSASDLDQRADIWALGVLLYRLVSGRLPFDATTTAALAAQVLNRPAPRLLSARPDIPPALDEIVARCLERVPARRFADMSEVAAALDALAPVPVHADRPDGRDARGRARREVSAAPGRAMEDEGTGESAAPSSWGATRSGMQSLPRRSALILGLLATLALGFAITRVPHAASLPFSARSGEARETLTTTAATIRVAATPSATATPPQLSPPTPRIPPPEAASAPAPAVTAPPRAKPAPSSRPPDRAKRSPDSDIPSLR
jgi:hypothetical protein